MLFDEIDKSVKIHGGVHGPVFKIRRGSVRFEIGHGHAERLSHTGKQAACVYTAFLYKVVKIGANSDYLLFAEKDLGIEARTVSTFDTAAHDGENLHG